ncbi:hypothetical protein Taro_031124 [Colocasia esculenta]|uniref:Protein kinase domain-containing protein n=1 Tax=Colocasia esculenta TaxID=4460 RepID=A0A843VN51_COLES|nr:hypothetical protein [Colocasia esculenta]
MYCSDGNGEGRTDVDELRWRGLNKVVDDPVHLGRHSFDANGRIPDVLEIDEKLLIDPRQLLIGPKIGEGAHGKVYKGRYGPYGEQIVAIKILNGGNTPEEKAKLEGRFAREVNMMARVTHENLVKFIGACKDPFMVIATELLPGTSLRKYLNSLRPKQLDLHVAVSYALDIARAMECLHANGIIHRDLKPDNLLLTENQKHVKLIDFGLAREESVTEMMTAETGTYRWMAPELYSTVTLRKGEKKHYTNKVDVYSFGIVLWELITNRMPFEGMSNLQAAYAAAFKCSRKEIWGGWEFFAFCVIRTFFMSTKQKSSALSQFLLVSYLHFVLLSGNLKKQARPELSEDIAPELVFVIQSCWVEDPNLRPSFDQIIRMLNEFLCTIASPSPEPDVAPEVPSSKGGITSTSSPSARAGRKFSFFRQIFTTKKSANRT